MSRGGARPNAGRKSKAEEKKIRDLMKPYSLDAVKCLANIVTSKDSKDADKISASKLILAYSYGNPKDTVEQNLTVSDFSIKDVIKFSD